MLKKYSGLAIVEVIIVLAISGLLFAIVIGTFSARRRASVDDAARQVMSEIARVRNQAQQGYSGTVLDSGNELFGKAIVISNNSNQMIVKSLQQNISTGVISVTPSTDQTISMPAQLSWYINTAAADFGNSLCAAAGNYNSCNDIAGSSAYFGTSTIWLVFRNNTGQSYAVTESNFSTASSYTSANQKSTRFAFAVPGAGANDKAKYDSATAQYYANFDLSIPNNQSLTVVK